VRLALVVAAAALLGATGAPASSTLPDGTYRYAMRIGGSQIGNSVVVVRHVGRTIEIDENGNFAGRSLTSTRILDAQTYATTSYDAEADGKKLSLKVSGNAAKLESGTATATIVTPAGTPFVVNENMAAGFMTIAPLVLATGLAKFTLACLCGAFVAVPSQITTATRGSLTIAMHGQTVTLHYDPATNVLQELDLPVQNFSLVLLSHDATTAPPHASAPPAPLPLEPQNYTSRDVTLTANDGIKLAGTLTLPGTASAPYPAVLLVHGSGCNDRDETIGPNKVFAQIANHLSNAGYAVLRYDKRSCGKSGGAFPLRDRLIADARDALAFVRAQPEIDAKRIYVLGHSEGGELVPSIAIADRHLRGIVLMAPPALPLERVLMQQLLRNVPPAQQATARRKAQALFAAIESGKAKTAEERWLRSSFGIDPTSLIARVPCPMLILQGTKDIQVLPADTPRLVAAARAARRDLTVVMLDGDDHLFIKLGPDEQSTGGEYFVPAYLDPKLFAAIIEWLAVH
jgi:pimeloyl-ACP methyl ester carboxylesterase